MANPDMTRGRPNATPLIQEAARLLKVWPWKEAQHVEITEDYEDGGGAFCGYCCEDWPCGPERWRIAAESYLNTPSLGPVEVPS